ncbi:hypothetical protein SASPL_134664 [Salvia splendens]|uniref:Dirigent protein n=1 Tax=Salvia splendens TaxID=180675 RepID=A0A8X8WXA2_SALSN|nr:hypothetical protein SASPL_134664 [Salvia splendens]
MLIISSYLLATATAIATEPLAGPNKTVYVVANSSVTSTSLASFGRLEVFDDRVRHQLRASRQCSGHGRQLRPTRHGHCPEHELLHNGGRVKREHVWHDRPPPVHRAGEGDARGRRH